MSPDTTDITIRPQKGAWILVFIPFLVAAFAFEMVIRGIDPLWWVPPLTLISLVILMPFRDPFEIVFRASARTMEVRYRIGRRTNVYSFDELDFIQSYIRVSGEAETYVQLEVSLKNGKRISLMSEHAAWDSSALFLAWQESENHKFSQTCEGKFPLQQAYKISGSASELCKPTPTALTLRSTRTVQQPLRGSSGRLAPR